VAVLSDITSRVRIELGDQPKQFTKTFTSTAYTSSTISRVALTTNLATITTSAPHGYAIGQSVLIEGLVNGTGSATADASLNGTYTVFTTPSATTFTFSKTATNITSHVPNAGGTTKVSTSEFQLAIKPIDIYTLSVSVNGVAVTYPTGYTVEPDIGVVRLVNTPAVNSTVVITGVSFRYFTDDDICLFVNTAVEQHTHNRTNGLGSQMTIALIPPVEEYPIAILATIEALWALATDAAFDIDIQAPDGVSIPRSERYRQLTQTIQARWEQYYQLCSALNIGLWRIEMGTLRRVSRLTNKLVPVYMAQEIDDSRRPERVYIQNDLNGRIPLPTTSEIYDIALYQGDSWSAEFDFPFDTTGYIFKAQIRTYPGGPSVFGEFAVEIVDDAVGKILLSLTPDQTKYMPVRAFWDLQATVEDDPTYQHTFIRGQVFVTREVTI